MYNSKYPIRIYQKIFYETQVFSTQNDQNSRYNRYQFTHRSSSNDQKERRGRERVPESLKRCGYLSRISTSFSQVWTLQQANSSTEP